MNVDDKDIEPSTNLSLALGYSHQCIQRILNNDPGAGANAASKVDMTFVATNPLSELVWSPHKGLSLRCADGSFAEKNPSLSWGIGPTNMASGSSSDKPMSNTDKPINDELCLASLAPCSNLAGEVAGKNSSTTFPKKNAGIMPIIGTSLEPRTAIVGKVEETKNELNFNFLQIEDRINDKGEDEAKQEMAQIFPTCEAPIVRNTVVSEGNHTFGIEIVLASEVHTGEDCEAQKVTATGKGHGNSPLIREIDIENNIAVSSSISPLEKLEATAENDLETPFGENVCGVKKRTLALESDDRIIDKVQKDDELLSTEMSLAVKQPSFNTRLHSNQIEGNSKALSDGDANEKMLNEDEGSHESVKSCNSARVVSTGKRRWYFDQQLIVESKRVKRQAQDGPGSSSQVKQDSSFVNWISNMMKGFLKSSEGEPSLSPAFANPNLARENLGQETFTSNRKEDPPCRTTGFESIFQSLYIPKTNVQDAVTLNDDHQTEGSKDCEQGDKACDLSATPIACRMVTGNVYKWFLPSNEKFDNPTYGNQAGASILSRDRSMNLPATGENDWSISSENRNSCNLATGKEKNVTIADFSQWKHKTGSVGKIDSEFPSDEKTDKRERLESLWIARFTPKTSGTLLNQYNSKSTGEALKCSDAKELKPHHVSSGEHENVEAKKHFVEEPLRIQYCGTADEASFGFYKVKAFQGDKSTYQQDPFSPPRIKSSEAIASAFARRLDALKHIAPSNNVDAAAHAAMTCFFCGIKGHHLRECSDVTASELEDLLRNISLNEGMEELACLCIRCLQHDHWAVACPSIRSRARDQAECNASLTNHSHPNKIQLGGRIEEGRKLKDITASAPTVFNRNDSGMEQDMLNWMSNDAATSEKMKLKEIASSSREKGLKENQMMPLCGFINILNSDIPQGILDAIRSLRLTRTNILKWMNSNVPLSPLDGYFLRLRLGKWEEGLGGTGYYVARITGIEMGSVSKKSKKTIAVNVGGIKCVVESQYVSNHDFLEDELRAWWSATAKGGGKLPTEEELRMKMKGKERLGL